MFPRMASDGGFFLVVVGDPLSAIRTEIPKAASHTGAGPSSGSLIAIE